MKKLSFIISILLALTFALAGCGVRDGAGSGDGNNGGDITQGGTSGGGDGEEPPEDPGEEPPEEEGEEWDGPAEDLTINFGSKTSPKYAFTKDGNLTETTREKQATVNTLAATDDFGRSFEYTDGFGDKYVCLFYFLWLGQHGDMTDVYDISKLLKTDPATLWSTTAGPGSASPVGAPHHWGEPLYGYYNGLDYWVLRKHVELFVAAGIDVLVFDVTNKVCYFPVVERLANVLRAYQSQGWKVPKFMFYTHTDSNETVRTLYQGTGNGLANPFERDGFYKHGNFSDLWFQPNGKPQIVAEADELDADLKAFFDVWESTWPDQLLSDGVAARYEKNGFPWIDWNGAPKHKAKKKHILGTDKGGAMSVSVAQHNRAPFSNAVNDRNNKDLAKEREYMWGRGYTRANKADHSEEAIYKGLNFEEEWQDAITNADNLKYVHVTGWNEWIAGKFVDPVEQRDSGAYFVDQVNLEYSRDAEMMKGGYADNVYLQLARNVRAFKGKKGEQAYAANNTIDVTKGLKQWNAVTSIYDDFTMTAHDLSKIASVANRDALGFDNHTRYTDNSMVNDIKSVRVTHDEQNVYFLVECVDNIVGTPAKTKNKLMNILIDVEGQDNDNALGGYNYIVNRMSSFTGDCGVEKISKSGTKLAYEQTGKGTFSLGGKYMQLRVSKRSLGIRKNARFTIRFKVADNVTNPEDISSYYTSGECAPVGRLSYSYKGGI